VGHMSKMNKHICKNSISLDLRRTESVFSHTALKLTSLFNSTTIFYMHRTFFSQLVIFCLKFGNFCVIY
jgi:hypothetical protein